MNLEIARLVSFKKGDKFINGINFNLTVEQTKKIVEHYKSLDKWTDYYYCEIDDYTLTNDDLLEICNLRAPFWLDNKLMFSFQIFRIDDENDINTFVLNQDLYCIQGIYKRNNQESHFFICEGEILERIKASKFKFGEKIDDLFLTQIENKHLQFDMVSYDYYLLTKPAQKVYIGGKDLEDIATDYTEGYWDDEE